MSEQQDMIERTTKMAKPRSKAMMAWIAAAVSAAAVAAIAPVATSPQSASAMAGIKDEGIVCTENTNPDTHDAGFLLTAKDGYITTADGNSIYMWGYANGNGAFQYPGPVLCVETGDKVTITLHNSLSVATSIQFPGQKDVKANGSSAAAQFDGNGALKSLTAQVEPGATITYSFTAGRPGTFLYESGTDPEFQVQMGLAGMLVVRPHVTDADSDQLASVLSTSLDTPSAPVNATTAQRAVEDAPRLAYGGTRCTEDDVANVSASAFCQSADNTGKLDIDLIDPNAIYSENHEYMMFLSEVDPDLHAAAEVDGITTSDQYHQPYHAHYFFINGRSLPDNIAPNGAPWLPSQPYGALSHVEPFQLIDGNGLKANPVPMLVRYAAIGVASYPMHPHSNHERVVSVDAYPLRGVPSADNKLGSDLSEERFAVIVNPGSTLDATFKWTNVEDYADADGQRVPVPTPEQKNLTEGDLWSGTPYLGAQGQLNPGITQNNQCGEYFHVVHSHDLTQATNYGVTFGGMLTLIRVDPGEHIDGSSNGCAE
jgi:FtsP/CotA-like multicopper oxidase with cupredoxin domain